MNTFNIIGGVWKTYAQFGVIDVSKEPEVQRQFPTVIISLPYAFRHVKDEDDQIVNIKKLSDPKEFRKLFSSVVHAIDWIYVEEFLEHSKPRYKPRGLPKFNFITLRHDPNTPFSYLKKGLKYKDQIKAGILEPIDRAKVIRYTDAPPSTNLLISYVKMNEKGEREHILEPLEVNLKGFFNATNLAIRHALVGKKTCIDYFGRDK